MDITYLKKMIKEHGLPDYEEEYRFHPVRRWRFDIAWPDYKVALEYDGGIYMRGRHNRPIGFARDVEKLNMAVVMGWRVLRCTNLTNISQLIVYLEDLINGNFGS